MSDRIMLIAGCSHSVGSEIDGSADSMYNRQHSYGNLFARKLGYKPVNIAVCGYTNSAIARSVLEWFDCCYDKNNEVFVLIGWTESSRIEAPFEYPTWHNEINGKYCDWFSKSSTNFLQINPNYKGYSERENIIQNDYQTFVIKRTEFTEIYSINLILQIQFFLKLNNCNYLMTNTGYMFSEQNNKFLQHYYNLVDKSNYYNFDNHKNSFYIKYKDLGYTNTKAKYGHHDELPHKLYANELLEFIQEKK